MSADALNIAPRPRKNRAWLIVGIVGLVLLVLVLFHLFFGKKPKAATPPQVVSTATATLGDMPETLSELGTVTPIATVNVLPQLSGYLTAVGYQEGQEVAKGQFLAQIDPRQYEIDKQQAEAQLTKDQASLAQARSDLARYTQLHQQKSIAEQTYEDQKFTVQQDEAAVEADHANIAQFELDIAYCHITAPVAGRVGIAPGRSGQLRDPVDFARHRDHHHHEADHRAIHGAAERAEQGAATFQFRREVAGHGVQQRQQPATRQRLAVRDQQSDGDQHRHGDPARHLRQ